MEEKRVNVRCVPSMPTCNRCELEVELVIKK